MTSAPTSVLSQPPTERARAGHTLPSGHRTPGPPLPQSLRHDLNGLPCGDRREAAPSFPAREHQAAGQAEEARGPDRGPAGKAVTGRRARPRGRLRAGRSARIRSTVHHGPGESSAPLVKVRWPCVRSIAVPAESRRHRERRPSPFAAPPDRSGKGPGRHLSPAPDDDSTTTFRGREAQSRRGARGGPRGGARPGSREERKCYSRVHATELRTMIQFSTEIAPGDSRDELGRRTPFPPARRRPLHRDGLSPPRADAGGRARPSRRGGPRRPSRPPVLAGR